MRDEVYNTKEGFPVPEAHHPSDEQLLRLERGDATIINELTEGLTEYALNVVSHTIRVKPNYKPHTEDLNSVAMLTLLTSLEDLLGSSFQALGLLAYLRKRIEGVCQDYVTESTTIGIPARSARRLEQVPDQEKLRDFHLVEEDPFAEIEFDDFVEAKLSEGQQRIIRLRIAGHSLAEIATLLTRSESYVKSEMAAIRTIFQQDYFD
jgi:DNA-directed RNA polymerase specialized sigma subunit